VFLVGLDSSSSAARSFDHQLSSPSSIAIQFHKCSPSFEFMPKIDNPRMESTTSSRGRVPTTQNSGR
jgi:hypothetical protein